MRQFKIKICGITRFEDAIAACEIGCDYLGLIFVPGTPRCVDTTIAKRIVDSVAGRCRTVGVFRNADEEQILATKEQTGFNLVQLHGDEPSSLADSVQPYIKAITVATKNDLKRAEAYSTAEMIIFDRPKDSPSDNWLAEILPDVATFESPAPFLLAGGIDAHNVKYVCETLSGNKRFAGIDVASAIEQKPGIKDKTKMEALIKTAREVSSHAFAR